MPRARRAFHAAAVAACVSALAACGGGGVHRGDLARWVVAASASSVEKSLAAECAFDGDTTTRWSSAFFDRQRLEGRLDRRVDVDTVVILWETARAADFAVLLRTAPDSWTEVARKTGAEGAADTIVLKASVRADAVRIECDRRATGWGNSIFEVILLGSASLPPPDTCLIGWRPPPTEWEARERGIAERLIAAARADPATSAGMTDDAFLDLVERRAFDYFWWETNPANGLTKDRGRSFGSSEAYGHASVAAVGYALTAYAIGAERGWVPRDEALARVRTTLKTFLHGPVRNVHGFFPHFVNLLTGADEPGTEISTIDTVLFLAGMVVAAEYFDDAEVTAAARAIYDRVEWRWARSGDPRFVTHGARESGEMIPYHWATVADESALVYLLALGSPRGHDAASWYALAREPRSFGGYEFLSTGGTQPVLWIYPTLWYDFRGRTDRSGTDFHLQAALRTLAMRRYCIDEAARFPGCFSADLWGQGPADGLDDKYIIYGFPPGSPPTDGTVVPYAAAAALQWLPRHALRVLRTIYDGHRAAWGKYGFTDGLHAGRPFYTRDTIGLDQGTILIAAENHRTGLVWRLFGESPWVRETTRKIGWAERPVPGTPGGPVDLAALPWRLRLGDGDFAAPDLDDAGWTEAAVPDRLEDAAPEARAYDGVAWYRVAFDLDDTALARWRGGAVLSMGGVDDADTAFVNGTRVGETPGGPDSFKRPRRYAVPAAAFRSGRNVVAVRVTDSGGAGGIWLPPVEVGPAR